MSEALRMEICDYYFKKGSSMPIFNSYNTITYAGHNEGTARKNYFELWYNSADIQVIFRRNRRENGS